MAMNINGVEEVKEVKNGYECPVCGHISSNVWDAFGHLNEEHSDKK